MKRELAAKQTMEMQQTHIPSDESLEQGRPNLKQPVPGETALTAQITQTALDFGRQLTHAIIIWAM